MRAPPKQGPPAPRWRGRPGLAVLPPLVIALLGIGGVPDAGAGQTVRYSGGLQYATGTYVFDARSHSLSLTSRLFLGLGRFEATASAPVILRNGGVVTTVGDRIVPTGGEGHGAVARRGSRERIHAHPGEGMGPGGGDADSTVRFSESYRVRVGDPHLRAGGEVISGGSRLRSLRATAGVKVPVTELDSGVGTGEWDYTLGASATAAVGSVLLLGDLAYWWYGDLPELELRNGVSWGLAGAVAILDGRGTVMASLSGARRLAPTLDAPLSLGAALGYRLDSGWSVNGGLSAGLTESVPDLSLFVGWSRGLRGAG